MPYLSAVDLATLAIRAGWRGQGAARATAVMLAESSGNTDAHNTKNGNDARGLMQINIRAGAHPEYASRNLYDAETNVATGFELWRKDGWRPWDSSRGGQLLSGPVAEPAVLAAQARHPKLGLQMLAEGPNIESVPAGGGNWWDPLVAAVRFLESGENWGPHCGDHARRGPDDRGVQYPRQAGHRADRQDGGGPHPRGPCRAGVVPGTASMNRRPFGPPVRLMLAVAGVVLIVAGVRGATIAETRAALREGRLPPKR